MIDIRQPNITAATEREQLIQMRSYLYQLSQQLSWAFSTISLERSGNGGKESTAQENSSGNGDIDPQKVFAQIKGLIMKSADIIDAYYTEMNEKLAAVYLPQTDFDTFTQENDGNITALSEGQQTNAENITALSESQQETNAYIRRGLLEYGEDGTPIYGVEIGRTSGEGEEAVFDKLARFLDGRVSFYDSGQETAYLAGNTLYLTNAEISGDLILHGNLERPTASLVNLGLAEGVTESQSPHGRMADTGCFCQVSDGHVRAAFNCAFQPGSTETVINATAIPEAYRPPRPVCGLCPANDCSIVLVRADTDGFIRAAWAKTMTDGTDITAITWIDGYLDYCV